jgi:hypothetical protein
MMGSKRIVFMGLAMLMVGGLGRHVGAAPNEGHEDVAAENGAAKNAETTSGATLSDAVTSEFSSADAQIFKEIGEHSEAMENLEHLSDAIGPRVTGSPQLKIANEWTAEMFRKYGLTNVHLEPYTIAHSWTRGAATASIIKPTQHPLTIAAAGWSPSTPGTVRGAVVYVEVKKKEDLEKYRGKLKGAIVIYQEPAVLSPPKPEDPHPVRAMRAWHFLSRKGSP